MAKRIYKAYRTLLGSPCWQRIYNLGARPQRLLWASTGAKDPKVSYDLYIKSLAAPLSVNTMPESTLKAFAEHGAIGTLLRKNIWRRGVADVLARSVAALEPDDVVLGGRNVKHLRSYLQGASR